MANGTSGRISLRLRRRRRIRVAAWVLLALLSVALHSAAHDLGGGGNPPPPPGSLSDIPCVGGFADIYPCSHVDLLAFLPTASLSGGGVNDIWGWQDPSTGVEYALLGLGGGTSFIDLSDPKNPFEVGFLPTQTTSSSWRDIKVHADHAFIVSEAPGHGMQVFDLRQLGSVTNPPTIFASTAHYGSFGGAHNLFIDELSGIAYAVGSNTCSGGLHMVDVSTPQIPTTVGCYFGDGYTHDVQCVVYRGPDIEHWGKQICLASNEDTLTIIDVTQKSAPLMLSRSGYAGSGYVHQGWLSEDQAYFLLDDELDEMNFLHGTRTYVWDLTDLDAPLLTGNHTASRDATDHNQYVVGNHTFQANYRSGLRILRLGNLALTELVEIAFFDTEPADDARGFGGTWSVYPFFASGVVVASDVDRGLFVLAPNLSAVRQCADGIDNDRDGWIDMADPHCTSTADNHERGLRSCGLGFEVAPLLGLASLRLRRRGSRMARAKGSSR